MSSYRVAWIAAFTALLSATAVAFALPGAVLTAPREPTLDPHVLLAASGDPVIVAAGDIACDPSSSNFRGGDGSSNACRQKYTSDLIVNSGAVAVLPLGDNQYYCGGLTAFQQSYDLSWGRVKSITRPAVGNHEYLTSGGTGCNSSNSGADGYFSYFGSAAGQKGKGYYSYDVGAWHLVALNSNCSSAGGCGSSSPQYQWLQQDLAAHPAACTLAYWHIPLYSSGGRASSNMQKLWQLLYDSDADLVLSSHDHTYERFAPQDANAKRDNVRGLRSFIVGSGGANHTSFVTTAANSEVRDSSTFGVLKLTLHPTSYDWTFLPEAGKTFTDSGTTACHGPGGGGGDTIPPSTPTEVTATATSSASVDVHWTDSTDNVAVTGYTVFRGGVPVGTPTGNSFTDTTVAPSTTYSYTVSAQDGAGNSSAQSAPDTVTTPAGTGVLTFSATADAYIRQDQPNSNAGTSTSVQADGSPVKRALLQFSVSGVSGGVANAKLRLYCVDPSSSGGSVQSVTGSWSEATVTWNTSPTFGSTISSVGSVSTGQWYEFDVTPLVGGNGTVSIGIVSSSSNGADYSSREGTLAQRPQLVIMPAT
jgi:chitodextrinase